MTAVRKTGTKRTRFVAGTKFEGGSMEKPVRLGLSGGEEMRKIRKTILAALLVVLSVGSGAAQLSNNSNTRDIVRRIQSDTTNLRTSAQNAADRGNYRVNELNQLITNLDASVQQLDRRLSSRRDTSADARLVLDRAAQIDSFFANNRIGSGTQRDWQTLRSDLEQLASAYNLNSQWRTGGYPANGNASLNDYQLRQLIQRIDSRTTTFSRLLRQDLNQRNVNDRIGNDRVRQQLTSFETGVVQLRNRTPRQITSGDVNNLLQSASAINSYASDRRLSYQTQNTWTQLRSDLEALASAFNVAADWSSSPGNGNGYPDNRYPSGRDLTGTYRIASNQTDDAHRAVDDATRIFHSQNVNVSTIRCYGDWTRPRCWQLIGAGIQ
jgi:hypothetical protein